MVKTFLKTGVGLIGASTVVGTIPNVSGTQAESNLKGNFQKGIGKVGNVLPVYGTVVGLKLLSKPVKKLKKPIKKIVKGGL